MSMDEDISKALTDRVRFAALFDPDNDIKWPGLSFERSNERRQLEVVIFFNNPTDQTWGAEKIWQGILQLNVIDPLQVGLTPLLAIASQLTDAFAKGSRLINGVAKVKIEQHPRIMSLLEGPEFSTLPVSIPWRTDNY